mmetsp:Transcript_91916/g.134327  ORF Transcript_91916/g.134327 Transcript_91916/m.134327 type:complete len:89 (+) Transcript_91916:816-1082(+)
MIATLSRDPTGTGRRNEWCTSSEDDVGVRGDGVAAERIALAAEVVPGMPEDDIYARSCRPVPKTSEIATTEKIKNCRGAICKFKLSST